MNIWTFGSIDQGIQSDYLICREEAASLSLSSSLFSAGRNQASAEHRPGCSSGAQTTPPAAKGAPRNAEDNHTAVATAGWAAATPGL